jgi:ketosteroid isomerase-like protein
MKQSPSKIRKLATELDNALEEGDVEKVISFFSDNCEIELLGTKVKGKRGVRKWLSWMFKHVSKIRLTPRNITVDGDAFYEEFIVTATLPNRKKIESKQSEVLVYENYKIKSLRLYFDRLDFAEAFSQDPISRLLVNQVKKGSLKGLE